MDLFETFHRGMTHEETFPVEDDKTAIHVGSGASKVLATPWMIAFMERVSHRLLAEKLPAGYSSVGVLVNVRHMAPTPVNSEVRVKTEILGIDGLHVTFAVQAWDSIEKIGEGQHQRVVIDEARFLERVASKNPGMQKSEK
jgi:fluoroacetyl-CoA thioesterase